MNRTKKIPTLIGVLMLVFGLAGGVVLVNKDTIFKLGASPDTTPKDVRVTNMTDASFTVNWTTDKQTIGLVKWGTNSTLGEITASDTSTKATYTHSITLKNLSANKTYYFAISSGGVDATNNGVPWNATTLASIPSEVTRTSGTIFLSTGTPADDAIVYIDAPGMSEQSTTTSTSGNWIMAVPLPESAKDTLLNIYVQGGPQGISTAQVYLSNANPVISMTLGKTYDLLTKSQTSNGNLPESSVTLPSNTSSQSAQQSRFDLTTKATPSSSQEKISIKSIDNGETVYTTKPEFFGDAPASSKVTVTVHSATEITQKVTTAADGTWKWTPPSNLEEGSHTITLTWKDAQGILQSVTKTFVVVANAQEPSFVSTPSASLTPAPTFTPIPTLTSTPTATPKMTPTIKPTPTKSATPSATPIKTATPSALPAAGSPLGTFAFVFMGISLILGGVFINLAFKK